MNLLPVRPPKQSWWLALLAVALGAAACVGCGPAPAGGAAKNGEQASSRATSQPEEPSPADLQEPEVNESAPEPAPTAAPAPAETTVAQPSAEKRPANIRPPADRGPQRPGDAEKITFDDLNLGLQADVVFRPFMLTDRAKELDGKRVSIAGYMHGAVASKSGIKEFVLLRNLECKFGPGGQADHLAQVTLDKGSATSFSPSPIKVEGKIKIEPFEGPDGNTWAIYKLEEAKVL